MTRKNHPKKAAFAGMFVYLFENFYHENMSSNFFAIFHIFIPCIFVVSAVAFGVLWLLFKFYFKEYTMDVRSTVMLSLKTFGTFVSVYFIFLFWIDTPVWPRSILAALASFIVARRLFLRSGLEKKEVWRIALPWFAIMLVMIAYFLLPLSRGILLLTNEIY